MSKPQEVVSNEDTTATVEPAAGNQEPQTTEEMNEGETATVRRRSNRLSEVKVTMTLLSLLLYRIHGMVLTLVCSIRMLKPQSHFQREIFQPLRRRPN
jgi:hypothetical protein